MHAIGNGDTETAWRLLHPSVRKDISRSQFTEKVASLSTKDKAFWKNWGREIKSDSVVNLLKRGPHRIRILQGSNGEWRIGDTGLTTTSRMSPKLALTQFRQWILARNYRGIYEMAPMAERQTLSPAIIKARLSEAGVADELVATLNSLIQSNNGREIDRNHWTIEAGRHMAILILEDEGWHISDVR